MYRLMKLALVGLTIFGPVADSVAAAKTPKFARCDGKSRRPANIYGSILPSVDPASGTVVPATARPGGVDVFPPVDRAKPVARVPAPTDGKPVLLVPPISSATPPSAIRSC